MASLFETGREVGCLVGPGIAGGVGAAGEGVRDGGGGVGVHEFDGREVGVVEELAPCTVREGSGVGKKRRRKKRGPVWRLLR